MKNNELHPMVIDPLTCPRELRSGIEAIQLEYPHRFAPRKGRRAGR